jgi:hypothetical protein
VVQAGNGRHRVIGRIEVDGENIAADPVDVAAVDRRCVGRRDHLGGGVDAVDLFGALGQAPGEGAGAAADI